MILRTTTNRRPTLTDGRPTIAATEAQARSAGNAAGRRYERARVAAILNAPEARGKERLALELALDTSLDAAAARAALGRAVPDADRTGGRSGGLVDSMRKRFAGNGSTAPVADIGQGLAVAMRKRFSVVGGRA